MRIRLRHLVVTTRRTVEQIDFSESFTFIHGPIGKGKSTVARLIDYCLGGELERTPAIQQEFVAAELALRLGDFDCTIERSNSDTQSVRATWSKEDGEVGSVNAPLDAQTSQLLEAEVYNLSDLIFYLCGVDPIKVRRSRDPDSPLIRLSIRDVWRYCYLDQTHLDSSFFRLEDPFRGRKSQDAMRFFTGLHSERLSELDSQLMKTVDEQRSKREAVVQIRSFMSRFELGSEIDIQAQLQAAQRELSAAKQRRLELEGVRRSQTHPTDELRGELRRLSSAIEVIRQSAEELEQSIGEEQALRAELITAKTKADRADRASRVLEGVRYRRCPECGTDVSDRTRNEKLCGLCGSNPTGGAEQTPLVLEALRRDFNERIDQIAESIERRQGELGRTKRHLDRAVKDKEALDAQLQDELERYDSAFVESARKVERELATLAERISSLQRLQQMPQAIDELERDAGALQGKIDVLRSSLDSERARLSGGDANLAAIAREFKRVMLAVKFPGVSEDDEIVLLPRNWKPEVVHGDVEWGFWDAGSGGKKTLFNVCYALAVHSVAQERTMPVPNILVIDSPTKNISEDEDPEVVAALYAEIYRLAAREDNEGLQFLVIDSDLVPPSQELPGFLERRMAGEPDDPSLIPYYTGP